MKHYPHHIGDFSDKTRISKLPIVYVLATHDLGFIKIGMTKAFKQRMVNIQSGCPFKLTLWLGIRTPKPKSVEFYLLNRMNHCNSHGEWFKPNGDDLDYLIGFFTQTNKQVKEAHCALLQA